ncbi:DUF3987 domain-containing protein [Nonomuraea endophytica]|uniref:DUF3987 domain-containing protein n=1 Tax=Nonomuraea endophytica TaxID=714136 RepID=A0A7W8A2V2_9ACTN|nr:DUF3987 domain-containing protein [Nonomuraea endophytica]MBB5077959.1 hypothetical protein [Nonomuraea endophytica]
MGRSGVGAKGTATGIARRVVNAAFSTFAEESTVDGLPATGLGLITELSDRAEGTLANPVWFVEEEGDALLSNARRDAKLGVYLRKAFDAQSLAHKTKVDDLRVRRPHLGLIMHVQPKNWAAVAGGKDATGGTWNRVLPVWVEQSKVLPLFESADAHEVIRQAGRALRQAGEYARQVDTVTVPAHVARVFETKHRPIVRAMIATEAMSQYAERAMIYMIRLAGLFALSERRDEISEADFDAALALVTYSIQTIAYVLPEAEASEETALAVKIENFVKEAGHKGVQSTVLYRKFGLKKADLELLLQDLDTIEAVKMPSTGGRPALVYRYAEPLDESGTVELWGDDLTEEVPEVMELPSLPEVAPEVVSPEPVAPATPVVRPVTVNPDLPKGVDALRAFFQSMEGPETAPEPEEEVTEEAAVSEDAVKAYLASPAGAELLQGILAQMLAVQAPQVPQEAPTAKPKTTRRSRAKSAPEALFPAAEVAA